MPGLPAAFSDADLHLDEFFNRNIGFGRPGFANELRVDFEDAKLHDVLGRQTGDALRFYLIQELRRYFEDAEFDEAFEIL